MHVPRFRSRRSQRHEGTKALLGSCVLAALCIAGIAVAVVAAQQAPIARSRRRSGPLPALKLPPIEKRTLSNGLQVWIIGRPQGADRAPRAVDFAAGIAADPPGKFGAREPDRRHARRGRRHAQRAGRSPTPSTSSAPSCRPAGASTRRTSTCTCRSRGSRDALPIMADVVARPTFPGRGAEAPARRAPGLPSRDRRRPGAADQVAFPAAGLRREAPLRHAVCIGTAASLKGITVADLKAFHAAHYRPSSDCAHRRRRRRHRGRDRPAARARAGRMERRGAPAASRVRGRRAAAHGPPGLSDRQARRGAVADPHRLDRRRHDRRRTTSRCASSIRSSAKSFTSRLNTQPARGPRLRLRRRIAFRHAAEPGRLLRRRRRADRQDVEALKEFFNELTRIHEPVPAEELEKAKNYLALQMPRNFETTRGTANALAQAVCLQSAGGLLRDVCRPHPRGDRRRRQARRRQVHPARQVRGRDRRRPQGDRAGDQGAEPRTDHGGRRSGHLEVNGRRRSGDPR